MVALVAGSARVEFDPAAGGAIASFNVGGADVLCPTRASYPLVPYSNRIADARLAFDGRVHELARNFGDHPHAIHGVGWQRPWTIAACDATSALLALDHEPVGDGVGSWPWPLRAKQSLRLREHHDGNGAVLALKLTIANPGATRFPFGLGWHPFFVRSASSRLGFRATGVWETDATRLPTVHAAIPPEWRFDPPRVPGRAAIDNVFSGWDGEATLTDADRGIVMTLRADHAIAFLVVYAPEGEGFLALEPVTHMTDAFNRAARGECGTGTRTLAPGGAFSCTMEIEVRPSP